LPKRSTAIGKDTPINREGLKGSGQVSFLIRGYRIKLRKKPVIIPKQRAQIARGSPARAKHRSFI
jgi:hypothetical protein